MGFERASLVWLVGDDVKRTIQGGEMEGRVRKKGSEDNQARWEMAGPDGESVQYGFLSKCWMIGDCKAPTRIGAYAAIAPRVENSRLGKI